MIFILEMATPFFLQIKMKQSVFRCTSLNAKAKYILGLDEDSWDLFKDLD